MLATVKSITKENSLKMNDLMVWKMIFITKCHKSMQLTYSLGQLKYEYMIKLFKIGSLYLSLQHFPCRACQNLFELSYFLYYRLISHWSFQFGDWILFSIIISQIFRIVRWGNAKVRPRWEVCVSQRLSFLPFLEWDGCR